MSFINYSNIVGYVEAKINAINTLSANEAALVAAMANLLAGRNNPPSNMLALETYLQGKENLVTDADLVKDVTLLLGASLPSKNTVWKMREFLANDNFTVPLNIAGDVAYVTGCGGGGSGSAIATPSNPSISAAGGNSGCYVNRFPVQVVAGDVVPVVIGAGGAAVSATATTPAVTTAGNVGADSSFGALIIKGGGVGVSQSGGWVSGGVVASTQFRPESSIAHRAGLTVQYGNTIAFGAGAGAFGAGADGTGTENVNTTGVSAAANSGAGGGSVIVSMITGGAKTATSGAGGSGRIIVEWQEFV